MYLMSIKPRYAYRIFAGIKKYELRRWIGINLEPGSIIVVYASGKVRALIGEFIAGKVVLGTPEKIWEFIRSIPSSGVGLEDKGYITGSKSAMAIEVVKPRLYKRPIELRELRMLIPGFNPPLSFREIDYGEPLYRLLIRKLRSL